MELRQTLIINNEKRQAPISSNTSPDIAILTLLDLFSPINLDDLVRLTPEFTWNQVFHAVDVLSRQAKISLRRRTHGYEVMGISAPAHRSCDESNAS